MTINFLFKNLFILEAKKYNKLFSAVRCGAVRCGAVRCGAVRCGAVTTIFILLIILFKF
ncbi:hypothetical protein [Brachyspira hyodysenteriae]|uniref:hypothetical protein n=1 Tax=Brachyspira hyodysenteriae TaxID=159 RepID=UPI0016425805|nr:hypothetical protein [Brachyspira hyodysenteriae]